jgi:hypothetical protein
MAAEWEVSLVCPYCAESKLESRGTCGKPACSKARADKVVKVLQGLEDEAARHQLEALLCVGDGWC